MHDKIHVDLKFKIHIIKYYKSDHYLEKKKGLTPLMFITTRSKVYHFDGTLAPLSQQNIFLLKIVPII